MLGGEPGQGLSPELGEAGDGAGCLGEAFPELGDLVLEPFGLGVAGIGLLAGLLDVLELLLELLAQAGVRAAAVEGGAVDAGLAGEGLDVALPAGRDVAAQEAAHGRPDPRLVVQELLAGEPHRGLPAAAASSIRSRTRAARS